ncbi:MAG: tetratricopeptide repeat protein [Spirulina sp.]
MLVSEIKTDRAIDINELFAQAYQAYESENYKEAETILRRILQLNSDSQIEASAYNSLGDILHIQGRFNEAVETYRNVLETNSQFFVARVKIGVVQYQMGRVEAARASLNEAREFLPEQIESLQNLNPYISLSTGLRQSEQFHESLQVIRQAIRLNPYVANGATCQLTLEALEPLGIPVSLDLLQYRSARCELHISLPLDPTWQEQPEEMRSTWQEQVEEIYQTIRTHIAQNSKYAELYQKVGLDRFIIIEPHTLFQPDYANDRIDKAHAIARFNLGISLLNRAILTDDAASLEEAMISLQSSLEYDPTYPWTYLYLSIASIARGQGTEAMPIARQALQLPNAEAILGAPTSTHSWAHNILGYALQLQGELNAAATEYQSALQLDETFTTPRDNLEKIR